MLAYRRRRMTTVAIAGASGVVGARVLRHLLARDDVGRVVAVGRRELAVADDTDRPLRAAPAPDAPPESGLDSRLVSRVVDFADPATIVAALPDDLSVAFCCLGTTMRRAGSKEAFRAVDYDAVVAFAESARARGARRLVVVSSIGADPGARSFYLRTKGEVEEALSGLGFAELVLVRPTLLDDEGARAERRPAERLTLALARPLFRLLGRTRRYAPIPADTVARAMVRLGLDAPAAGEEERSGHGAMDGVRVVESEELHVIGREGSLLATSRRRS